VARFVLRFVFGSFFPQLHVFNNFSASCFGSLLAINVAFPFVFSNFSGSFLKKVFFLFFAVLESALKRPLFVVATVHFTPPTRRAVHARIAKPESEPALKLSSIRFGVFVPLRGFVVNAAKTSFQEDYPRLLR
jgi:hypothetical protein